VDSTLAEKPKLREQLNPKDMLANSADTRRKDA